jgi:hypothetical protein
MQIKTFKIVKIGFMIKVKCFARKFLYQNFIYFSLLNTLMSKGKDPDPYL